MFVVALRIRVAWWKFRLSSSDQKRVNSIVPELPLSGSWIVFADKGKLRKLAKKIRAVPDSLAYVRR